MDSSFPSFCAVYHICSWKKRKREGKEKRILLQQFSFIRVMDRETQIDANEFVVVTAECLLRDNQKLFFSSSCGMQW